MTQVRIAVLAGFDEQVRDLNRDPEQILQLSNLPPTFIADHTGDDRMKYEQVETLLQTAAEVTGCPYFGALLGTKQNISFLGIVGYIMQQSRDVRSALRELCQNFSLHVRDAAFVEVDVFGEFASLNFHVSSDIKIARQTSELAMSEGMATLRALCGDGWKPISVNFSHTAPESVTPYRKIFGVPVHFDQEKTHILFSKNCLDTPILEADPVLRKILKTHIDLVGKVTTQNLRGQVDTLIRRTLPTGKCSIDNVAGLMAIHRRTLHRKLKRRGTSFSELLENVRKSVSVERLRNSNMTITQLAYYLGYADNSAFTRAFKRWHGVTPQRWRESNR